MQSARYSQKMGLELELLGLSREILGYEKLRRRVLAEFETVTEEMAEKEVVVVVHSKESEELGPSGQAAEQGGVEYSGEL